MGNLLELGLSLSDRYKQYFIGKLKENGLQEEAIEEIIGASDFRQELILSLNKRFKHGREFACFCQEEGLQGDLPQAFDFTGHLYIHQEQAIQVIRRDCCTVISTGTGSGKTESFLIPIIDYCLKHDEQSIKAVIVYPMNALAVDQLRLIDSVAAYYERQHGPGRSPVTFGIFTGNTPETWSGPQPNQRQFMSRDEIIKNQPDILITNYVMLDRLLTDPRKRSMFTSPGSSVKFVVLDELHTYRGTVGAHIKYLLLRLREVARRDVVQIGCSATLSRDKAGERQDGYIGSDTIDTYVNTLFSVETSTFIRPDYEETLASNMEEVEPAVAAFLQNPATAALRDCLQQGCHSLTGCRKALAQAGIHWDEPAFIRYLKKLFELNNEAVQPVLDFRVHLFLRSLGGTLTRCLHCGHYQTSGGVCTECGKPTFPVYRKNYAYCVGTVSRGYLTNQVNQSGKNDVAVLINTGKSVEAADSLFFDVTYRSYGAHLTYNPAGKVQLLLRDAAADRGDDCTIELGRRLQNLDALSLFHESLIQTDGRDRKILAFIDNRESVARQAAWLNDQFLSQFFCQCCALAYEQGPGMSVAALYDFMLKELRHLFPENSWNGQIADVQKEFQIWLSRELAMPSRRGNDVLSLRLLDEGVLTDSWERAFIKILLEEKIVAMQQRTDKGDIIQFNLGSVGFKRVITLDERREASSSCSVLSFSSRAEKYKKFVIACPNLPGIVQSLLEKNILLEPEDKLYALNPDQIVVPMEACAYETFEEIRDKELLFAHAHTSEVTAEEREKHEKAFGAGQLNVLVATSTLEMGIDIGGLSMVYMLGVPPMPSNYAQRAGRAGRRQNRFALIVTMCYDWSSHDSYYFNHPEEMIEGTITPPAFDSTNPAIQEKHGYALLSGAGGTVADLQRCRDVLRLEPGQLPEHFCQTCNSLKRLGPEACYRQGYYPEYGFRNDEIVAVDMRRKRDRRTGRYISLAQREPERAYKDFVPGKEFFLGEHYYAFTNQGDYEMHTVGTASYRTYKTIFCDGEVHNVREKRDYEIFDAYVTLFPSCSAVHPKYNDGEILTAWLEKRLKLAFINDGHILDGETFPFHDGDGKYALRYDMTRDAILFRYDERVVSGSQIISLCMALDRTIKDELGMDEAEIGWVIDDLKVLKQSEEGAANKHDGYILLYDKAGFGNLNVQRIFGDLEKLFYKTYERLTQCPCQGNGGCYMCMKGYLVQQFSRYMNKAEAVMFSAYLCGRGKFAPVLDYIDKDVSLPVTVSLRLNSAKRHVELFQYGKLVWAADFIEQNEAIFSGLAQVLVQNLSHLKAFVIEAREDYLVQAINGSGSVKKGQDQWNRFRFYTLAYDSVSAKKV